MTTDAVDCDALLLHLRNEAAALGFSQIGVAGVDLASAEPGLLAWLEAGFHGTMGYMQRHGVRRARPAELRPGTVSVITARLDYLPRGPAETGLANGGMATPGRPGAGGGVALCAWA